MRRLTQPWETPYWRATDTLEDRIDELNHVESNLVAQIHAIERAGHRIQHLLGKSLGEELVQGEEALRALLAELDTLEAAIADTLGVPGNSPALGVRAAA